MKLEDAPAVGSDAARPQSRASDAGTLVGIASLLYPVPQFVCVIVAMSMQASASRGINDILEHSTYGEGLMSGSGATDADISLPAEPEATIVQVRAVSQCSSWAIWSQFDVNVAIPCTAAARPGRARNRKNWRAFLGTDPQRGW